MLAAGVAVLLLAAAPASAGTPGPTESLGGVATLEYVKATHPNVQSQAGAPAACDDGDSATGGGGAISGGASNAYLNASHPTPSPGWQTEGRTTGIAARTVTTFAICGAAPTTHLNTTRIIAPAGDPGGADLATAGGDCGPTEQTLGGGLESASDTRLIASAPGNGFDWSVIAQNHGALRAEPTIWWGCSSGYDTNATRRVVAVKPNRAGTLKTPCRKSEAVVAGGFQARGGTDPARFSWATATRPFDSKKDRRKVPDDGWRATMFNDSASVIDLTVYAICAER
jgi:hypothetical protein